MKYFTSPLTSYRVWRIGFIKEGWRIQFRLVSMVNNVVWTPGIKMDRNCTCSDFFRHSCGVYSYKKLAFLNEYPINVTEDNISVNGELVVLGSLNIWGKCLVASRGYRSEYSYPRALYYLTDLGSNYKSAVNDLAKLYGTELIEWNSELLKLQL